MDSKNLFSWNKNTKIFLICIGLSIVVWLLQKLSVDHTLTISVPIAYTIPDAKTFAESPYQEAQVIVRGIGWDLLKSQFLQQDLSVEVILSSDSIQNINEFQIKDGLAKSIGSNKIQILDINPKSIPILLAQNFQKKVPLELKEEISFFPDHYLTTPILLEPDSISIFGPKEVLDTISIWYTEKLVLNKLKNNIQKSLKIENTSSDLLKLSTTSTIVTIEVEEFTEKIFELPVVLMNKKEDIVFGYKSLPDRARLYVTLPLSKYDLPNLEEFKLVAEIDTDSDNQSNKKAKLHLKLYPGYIQTYKIHPANVDIYRFE